MNLLPHCSHLGREWTVVWFLTYQKLKAIHHPVPRLKQATEAGHLTLSCIRKIILIIVPQTELVNIDRIRLWSVPWTCQGNEVLVTALSQARHWIYLPHSDKNSVREHTGNMILPSDKGRNLNCSTSQSLFLNQAQAQTENRIPAS